MARKHFMCTHTFVSQEAAKQFLDATLELTDRQIFEGLKQIELRCWPIGAAKRSFSSVIGMQKLTMIYSQP